MPKQRIGRWAVIGVLDDGRTLTGQNRPPFPKRRTVSDDERAERLFSRKMEKRERRAEDRRIREVLGVSVR